MVKSRRDERTRLLADRFPDLPPEIRAAAEESDDAFDALVAALAMDRHRDQLCRPPADDPTGRLEGEVWRPSFCTGCQGADSTYSTPRA